MARTLDDLNRMFCVGIPYLYHKKVTVESCRVKTLTRLKYMAPDR